MCHSLVVIKKQAIYECNGEQIHDREYNESGRELLGIW